MSQSITCPVCRMTSYSPADIEKGYCGNCHAFTGTPRQPFADTDDDRPLALGEFEALLRQMFGGPS